MRMLHVFAGRTSAAAAIHARRVAIAIPDAGHFSDLAGFEQPWPRTLPLRGRPSLARYRELAQRVATADLILGYGEGALDLLLAKRIFAAQLAPVIQFMETDVDPGVGARVVRALALPAAALTVGPDLEELPFEELRALYDAALSQD